MSFDYVRFGDLFAIPQKNGLTRPKKVRGTGVPMVNMGELFANPRIRNLSMDRVPLDKSESAFLLSPGDLLFARQSLVLAGAGQCSLFLGNHEPTTFESHLIRSRLDHKRANPTFYFNFFRSPVGRRVIEAIVEQGAGASGIRGSDLVNVVVPFPPISVQNDVAAILESLDDRITLLRETNATLEAIAQALFKSWFVDFDPVRAKQEGRTPEGMDEATAALFPNELGSWPTRKVAQLINDGMLMIGDGYRAKNSELGLPGVAFVRAGDLTDGRIVPTRDHLKVDSASKAPGKAAVPGDTVFTSKGTIGRFAFVAAGSGGAIYSPQVCFWRSLDCNELTPEFLHFWMKSPSFTQQVKAVQGQAAIMDFVSLTSQREMLVDVPPIVLQKRFSQVVRTLLERIAENREATETLSTLRDTLLPRLISGQLRLPEAESIVP